MDYGITVIVYCYILRVFVKILDFILFDIFSLICFVFFFISTYVLFLLGFSLSSISNLGSLF